MSADLGPDGGPAASPSAAAPPASPAVSATPSGIFGADSATRSFWIYLPATFLFRGLGMIRGLILAWLMRPEEFGLLQVMLLAVNVLTPLCGLGTYEGLARYVPLYETRQALRAWLARVLPVALGLTAGLSLLLCAAARPAWNLLLATRDAAGVPIRSPGGQLLLTWLIAFAVFATVCYLLLLAILRGLRMFRVVSLMELISNAGLTVLAVTVALLGARRADAIIICLIVSMLATMPFFAKPLRRLISRSPDQQRPLGLAGEQAGAIAQLLRFSVWAAMAAIMWQTLQYYPMWYLQKIHGPEITAVFGGVRQIAQTIMVIAVAGSAVVMTAVNKTWEAQGHDEADAKLALAFKAVGLLLVLGCMVLSALSGLLIRLLPPAFAPGRTIIPLSLLFSLICAHLSLLAIHFNLIEKTRHLFWPWTAGVACNAVFGLVMIRPHLSDTDALSAAAMSGVLAAAGALLACVLLLRIDRRPMDFGSYLVLAFSFSLLLPDHLQPLVAVMAAAIAATTPLVFSSGERAALRGHAATALARIRGGRR